MNNNNNVGNSSASPTNFSFTQQVSSSLPDDQDNLYGGGAMIDFSKFIFKPLQLPTASSTVAPSIQNNNNENDVNDQQQQQYLTETENDTTVANQGRDDDEDFIQREPEHHRENDVVTEPQEQTSNNREDDKDDGLPSSMIGCLDVVLNKLVCPICKMTLLEPRIAACQHVFCFPCIARRLNSRRSPRLAFREFLLKLRIRRSFFKRSSSLNQQEVKEDSTINDDDCILNATNEEIASACNFNSTSSHTLSSHTAALPKSKQDAIAREKKFVRDRIGPFLEKLSVLEPKLFQQDDDVEEDNQQISISNSNINNPWLLPPDSLFDYKFGDPFRYSTVWSISNNNSSSTSASTAASQQPQQQEHHSDSVIAIDDSSQKSSQHHHHHHDASRRLREGENNTNSDNNGNTQEDSQSVLLESSSQREHELFRLWFDILPKDCKFDGLTLRQMAFDAFEPLREELMRSEHQDLMTKNTPFNQVNDDEQDEASHNNKIKILRLFYGHIFPVPCYFEPSPQLPPPVRKTEVLPSPPANNGSSFISPGKQQQENIENKNKKNANSAFLLQQLSSSLSPTAKYLGNSRRQYQQHQQHEKSKDTTPNQKEQKHSKEINEKEAADDSSTGKTTKSKNSKTTFENIPLYRHSADTNFLLFHYDGRRDRINLIMKDVNNNNSDDFDEDNHHQQQNKTITNKNTNNHQHKTKDDECPLCLTSILTKDLSSVGPVKRMIDVWLERWEMAMMNDFNKNQLNELVDRNRRTESQGEEEDDDDDRKTQILDF